MKLLLIFTLFFSCKTSEFGTQTSNKKPTKNWASTSLSIAQSIESDNEELSQERTSDHPSDQCVEELKNTNQSFASTLGYFIKEHFSPIQIDLKQIGSHHYGVPQNSQHNPVSLLSHKMCIHNEKTLEKTMQQQFTNESLQYANQFAKYYNDLLSQLLSNDQKLKSNAEDDLYRLWLRLFGCIGYQASISSAEDSESQKTASKFLPQKKPNGVKFASFENQETDSHVNIGVFQFNPSHQTSLSNCITSWNKKYPKCSIQNTSKQNLTQILGSAQQHFNIFCGLEKTLQTFHVQVNTTKLSNTSPQNFQNNKLIQSKDRCVTLQIKNNIAFNHLDTLFGNNTEKLNAVYSCAIKQVMQ